MGLQESMYRNGAHSHCYRRRPTPAEIQDERGFKGKECKPSKRVKELGKEYAK
jgi:hypothetical protein